MGSLPPWGVIAIGLGFGLLGWLIILLTALHVIPSILWLLLLAWGVHVGGLFFGFLGLGMYTAGRRRR